MLYCRVNTVTITCTTTCTRRAIFEKMPLPSVTLHLIPISGQYNSLSPSWQQQSLVSILHLAAFFSVLQDLLKCVYVNSHFLIRVYLLQGWMEVGCCFTVIIYETFELFSNIYHSALCSPSLLKLLISSSSAHPHPHNNQFHLQSDPHPPSPPKAHHPP